MDKVLAPMPRYHLMVDTRILGKSPISIIDLVMKTISIFLWPWCTYKLPNFGVALLGRLLGALKRNSKVFQPSPIVRLDLIWSQAEMKSKQNMGS